MLQTAAGMDVFQALLLGVIQGITEWLPVSSEGQTMLTMIALFGITPAEALSWSLFMHLGTMIAVLIRFRREFLQMLQGGSALTRTVIISTVCTSITGVPLYFLLRESFTGGREATMLIGGLLIITGLLLRLSRSGSRVADDMSLWEMVVLGMAQGLSILPGVSRSGTTLSVMLMRKIRQEDALRISFVISVPAVIGAILLDFSSSRVPPVETALTMILSSLVAGYLTMDMLIRAARRISFSWFCMVLGMVTLLFALMG